MKKRVRYFILILILALGGIFVLQAAQILVRNYVITVSKPETAIAIARAVLSDRAPLASFED